MALLTSLLNNRIARRLVIYILLFSSAVTLILTALQLYRDYEYYLSLIDERFNDIQITNIEVLEKNIWLLNQQSLNLLLDGILRHQDIAYLEITDETGNLSLAKGVLPTGDIRQRVIPLTYYYRNKMHSLGSLRIVATLKYVYQRLIDTTLVILFTQAIKTFLVSMFIIFLVWKLITRHLDTIRDYGETLEFIAKPDKLTLQRRENSWTRNDELQQVVQSINSMQQKLYQSYLDIEHQSLHDHLTGLPNRRLLEDRLLHDQQQSDRLHQFGALMFIDIDHFKLFNDSLGHNLGDEVLKKTAKRLQSMVRLGDTVARIGGDEFIVLLSMLGIHSASASREAKIIGQKIQQKLNEKLQVNGHDYHISVSIGISMFQGSNEDCNSILKHADNAMYQAKADGRNNLRLYQSEMQEIADKRLSTERQLHAAIKNEEFVLYYQPKYDQQRRIVSAETLVRWIRPNGEMVAPGEFITIAEESGLIIPLGMQVIRMAFAQAAANLELLQQSSIRHLAINISPRQFSDPDFAETISTEIELVGLDPRMFIFELTEDAFIRNFEHTIQIMNTLKRKGFGLSIDDFGTGYSSLRYLKEFPLDELKIDQSFISQLVDSRENEAIVSTIITMAKNMGLDVVAEGIEKEEQLEKLVEYDCTMLQGYLLSRPVDLQQFLTLLAAQIKPSLAQQTPDWVSV